MKKIEAIINTYKFETLHAGLVELGITDITVSAVKGYQEGFKKMYRGIEYEFDFVPKIMVMIIVADDQADMAVERIIENIRTGSIGDGMIFMYPLENMYRMQSGKRGEWNNSGQGGRW